MNKNSLHIFTKIRSYFLFLGFLGCFSARVYGVEDKSWATFQAIDLKSDTLGILVESHLQSNHNQAAFRYYSTNLTNWNVKSLNAADYLAVFGSTMTLPWNVRVFGSAPVSSERFSKWQPKVILQDSGGRSYTAEQTECGSQEEGDPLCGHLYLTSGNMRHELYVKDLCPYGCRISAIEQFKEKIWVGLFSTGEMVVDGHGLVVFDRKQFRRLNVILPGQLIDFIRKDSVRDRVWVGTLRDVYVYDENAKMTGGCNLSVVQGQISFVCSKNTETVNHKTEGN